MVRHRDKLYRRIVHAHVINHPDDAEDLDRFERLWEQSQSFHGYNTMNADDKDWLDEVLDLAELVLEWGEF